MKNFKKEYLIFVIIGFFLGGVITYIFLTDSNQNLTTSLITENDNNKTTNLINENNMENTNANAKEIEKIQVYITGKIKSPGVYTMKNGDRIIDIFQKAGGATNTADLENINMASYLKDGEKIHIPSIAENNNISKDNNKIDSFSNEDKKININYATQKDLENLSGIGPSKAKAIIKYREEKGSFSSIKEIINVSGIGEATLENFEDEVSIK
ncbi:MAG: helix-hairpin-helix domain-containing protein [Bacillota bacterium]